MSNRIVPHCIKHHPGIVLDVALSSFDKRVLELVQEKVINSGDKHRLDASLPSDVQAKIHTLSSAYEGIGQSLKDGQLERQNEQLVAVFGRLMDEMVKHNGLSSKIVDLVSRIKELFRNNETASKHNELIAQVVRLQADLGTKQDEMKGLQSQALDRLARLQNGVQALLTQTYELHEYPIPRLFIVLPDDRSSWNPLDFFSNKFRLYFLCECGEHTKATKSNIPHRIHLAKHEGYVIDRPREFFQEYGSYVLVYLRMLKYGLSVAGVAVPALSNLIPDSLDQAIESLKLLTKTIKPGMDQVISYIEKVSTEEEALEGADLRQLEKFLKRNDKDRVLGNLQRTVTAEGHVKWVCSDHYDESHQETQAKTFIDTVESLKGRFDQNTGRVEVTLPSKIQAERFHLALEKARSVYELKLELDWEATQSDFKKLRDVLAITNVGVLELHLKQQDGPTKGVINRGQLYDPILGIMRHPSIQSFTIRGPHQFFKRSSLVSRDYDFSNLRHLDISLLQTEDDISGVECLVHRAMNLSSLVLSDFPIHLLLPVYKAIASYVRYPIIIGNLSMRIPPLQTDRHNWGTLSRDPVAHLVDVLSERFETLTVDGSQEEEELVDTIAKGTGNGLRLKSLQLIRPIRLSDAFITDLCTIATNSELHTLHIDLMEDKRRMRVLESVLESDSLKHLRELVITVSQSGLLTDAVKILANGVMETSEEETDQETPGKVNLEKFWLLNETYDSLPKAADEYLSTFVERVSLKELRLGACMTFEQVHSLAKSIDVSRLQRLYISTKNMDTTSVDGILTELQHAKEMRILRLGRANIAEEQMQQMKEKGITLAR